MPDASGVRPTAPFVEEELECGTPRRRFRVLVRSPRESCDDPIILVNLALDRRSSLGVDPYRIIPEIFLAAGHRAASFDLPNHGDLVDADGQGLAGIANAVSRGVDVFAEVEEMGIAAIDACLMRNFGREGRLCVCGTSRGALSALHVLAADRRAAAAALLSPVTHLPALKEFAALEGNPLVVSGSAESLIDRVGGRPVFVAINTNDPRVGTAHCLRFYSLLRAQSAPGAAVLSTYARDGHAVPERAYALGGSFLLEMVNRSFR